MTSGRHIRNHPGSPKASFLCLFLLAFGHHLTLFILKIPRFLNIPWLIDFRLRSKEEQVTMDDAVKEAADAVCEIVNVGIAQAMNDHNRKKEEK